MLDWAKKTYIMGILNLTPDSFSGDGLYAQDDPVQNSVDQAKEYVNSGADILDLGAESSRPGSEPINAEEELHRLLPVLKAIKSENLDVLISIDTYKAEVAKTCLDNGADWINDIWGLQKDPKIANVAAEYDVPLVIMHNRSQLGAIKQDARIGASYDAAAYKNFIDELIADILTIIQTALDSGVPESNLIVDPGIGFGKSVKQNLQIINCLDKIKALGYPVLIGPSNKSFIGNVLDLPVDQRTEGTAATVAIGIIRGADIVRVHNVKHMARIAKMVDMVIQCDCKEKK